MNSVLNNESLTEPGAYIHFLVIHKDTEHTINWRVMKISTMHGLKLTIMAVILWCLDPKIQ